MLMALLVLQLSLTSRTLDLTTLGLTVQSIRPVEADGDPATTEWLIFSANDTLYRLGREGKTPCLSAPFHPDGTSPSLLPKREYPVLREGTRDKLFDFNAATQTVTIYNLPSGCQP